MISDLRLLIGSDSNYGQNTDYSSSGCVWGFSSVFRQFPGQYHKTGSGNLLPTSIHSLFWSIAQFLIRCIVTESVGKTSRNKSTNRESHHSWLPSHPMWRTKQHREITQESKIVSSLWVVLCVENRCQQCWAVANFRPAKLDRRSMKLSFLAARGFIQSWHKKSAEMP
jgi:hypothetical protein